MNQSKGGTEMSDYSSFADDDKSNEGSVLAGGGRDGVLYRQVERDNGQEDFSQKIIPKE